MDLFIAKAPYWITRFGEIGIVVPLAVALTLWLLATTRAIRPLLLWLMPLGLAVGITTLSKIAFIGWGLGIAAIDFTGFSGHAMFSAAIYPVLGYTLATQSSRAPGTHFWAMLAGYALALVIGWSRVHIQVHSVSEVVAGLALGACASGWTIWHMPHSLPAPSPRPHRWVLLALLGWLVVMPVHAAPSRSHDMVTQLALRLSAHDTPFRRADLHAVPIPPGV
ncbi:phosphatase PAP2 family protein [Rhodoferax sp.]|uniref:phosphatase PAP2 family protein n=1 Tax=Rhodoferax sp. TaxID=50421 RepID=UPI0025EE2B63|nr:phosphatase PAP2 family protein [Rhodoferax sp.]